jgi:hypothetical protein
MIGSNREDIPQVFEVENDILNVCFTKEGDEEGRFSYGT